MSKSNVTDRDSHRKIINLKTSINLLEETNKQPTFYPNKLIKSIGLYSSYISRLKIGYSLTDVDFLHKVSRQFISLNWTAILETIICDQDDISLCMMYKHFYILSIPLNTQDKLILLHDVIMFLRNADLIPFIFKAIMKIDNIQISRVYQSIKNIVCFQTYICLYRLKNYEQEKLCLFGIIEQFSLAYIDFEILILETVGIKDGHVPLRFSNDLYDRGLCVKLIGHFLDWDWVFNTFFSKIIRENIDRCPHLIFFVGVAYTLGTLNFLDSRSINQISGFILEHYEKSTDTNTRFLCMLFAKDIVENFFAGFNDIEVLVEYGIEIEDISRFII